MNKAQEESAKIASALALFQTFVRSEKKELSTLLLDSLNHPNTYKNSFDLYHVLFSESYSCTKIITFDTGFKKFKTASDIDIEILTIK